MSLVTYNDIKLPFPLTTSFSWEDVYDGSNTDRIYRKLDATFQCVINADYASVVGSSESTAVGLAKYMVERLEIPRKTFSILFNGVEFLPKTGAPDAKNGPLPQQANYTLLTNTTFLMNFRIVAHYATGVAPNGPILSNRWTESQTIDSHNYSTRHRKGRFTIRADHANKLEADNYREDMCILQVPLGFIRDSSTYTVSEDGLTLDFDITDKEYYLMPPIPAYSCEGTYSETTPLNGLRVAEVTVMLRGQNDPAQHMDLIKQATLIAVSKMTQANNWTRWQKFEHFIINQSLYDNKVEVRLRAMLGVRGSDGSATNIITKVPSIDFNALAQPPLGSEARLDQEPFSLPRGTAGFLPLLHAAAVFDPGAQIALDKKRGLLTGGGAIPGKG